MLVEREDSQYSYRKTLVAMDADRVVGISVSYDGGLLHELRHANPDYPMFKVNDPENFQIWGTVIHLIRTFEKL